MTIFQRDKDKPGKKRLSVTSKSQAMMRKVPRVRDVMTKDPLTFTLGMTVHDAAKRVLQKEVVAAPVVDSEGNFVGMF